MQYKAIIVAAAMGLAGPGLAAPAPVRSADDSTNSQASGGSGATKPANSAATKYCVEVEPPTGSLLKMTECKTRAQWARDGVDVDQLKKD